MPSDYISICYGNIKNIRAVKIFTVRAFHFFSLIVSLVFNMLLVADPSIFVVASLFSQVLCVLEDGRGRKLIFVELNFLYSVLLYVSFDSFV
mgnify:FL=1